jgi:phenylalanyl-tRNA synthetase beta chain
MRVPVSWLYEYCDPGLDVAALEERLTMTGTKVETILRHGAPSVESFVVGRVLQAGPHPDADRLKVCKVDIGEAEPADIVCGAPNVAAGQTVAVALPGATMPGGMKIKAAKLRGVPSNGMILAADELEIDSDHSGIMVLDELLPDGAELAPGTPLAEVLPVGTDVVELEITPNRPDCLGVYGVARELHAATGAPLAEEPWREDPGEREGSGADRDGARTALGAGDDAPLSGTLKGPDGQLVQIDVQCPDVCRRFTARAFENVAIGPSPPWLKARLSAAGQRPINNVVDVTNYVMLLTAQPLHAFDLDRIAGARLTVRRARDGEPVATLDGQTRTLDSEMVVIEDGDGPTSIAGLMGGERSEVQGDTTRVLMEVANWSGPNIHRSSWTLGLRSEASSRFEKGLAPEQCMNAQALATRLMVELCGATLVPGTIDLAWKPVPAQTIRLREQRVQAILGMPVARERQTEILRALDFSVHEAEDGLDVTVPATRRDDVTREADLIEEVARIHGLSELPTTLPARRGAYGRLSPRQRLRRRALDALVGCGLNEAVGWTFTAPGLLDRLRLPADDPRRQAAVLENPLSEDQSMLRTSLLGSLLDAAAHNSARGMPDLRLFEHGTVFAGDPATETGVHEHQALAILLSGRLRPATWAESSPASADFFAVKGVLEALADALRLQFDCRPCVEPFLHPGRSAEVLCAGERLGWLGELHPLVARDWGIEGAGVAELDLDRLLALAASEHTYRDVISFPALSQDLAVVLPDGVAAAQVLGAVRDAAGKLLDEVSVFDVYSGAQVGEGKRSLALSLAFRAGDRTLSDQDVQPLREKIVAALGELGGELRG